MKRLSFLVIALVFLLAGCGPRVYLKWGEVEFESRGEHQMEDVTVTREAIDGTKITVSIKASKTRESEAVVKALDLAGEMAKRVPLVP